MPAQFSLTQKMQGSAEKQQSRSVKGWIFPSLPETLLKLWEEELSKNCCVSVLSMYIFSNSQVCMSMVSTDKDTLKHNHKKKNLFHQ